MRNPNGYGSVVNLGKGRRRPYAVRVTVGYDFEQTDRIPKLTQKYKYLSYHSSRKEAILALAEFNSGTTVNLDLLDITFAAAFERWANERFADVQEDKKPAVYVSYMAAYKKLAPIHKLKLKDIKTVHLQQLFNSDMSRSTLNNMRIVANYVFEWGLKNDVIKKNYADYIVMPKVKTEQKHTIFTTEEIAQLWQHQDEPLIAMALMLIFSGLRIGEFLALTADDVDIDNRCINIRQSKTAAGVRIVPIAEKVVHLWKRWKPTNTSRQNIKPKWDRALKSIGQKHMFHDTRHTCVSLLTAADVTMPIVQKIVGHSGKNVTEKVYLHLELPTLLEAINKI